MKTNFHKKKKKNKINQLSPDIVFKYEMNIIFAWINSKMFMSGFYNKRNEKSPPWPSKYSYYPNIIF